jgi:hydrophobic/amphiphilic exporter-1 (mainly G- bacteria), HAE1 family
VANSLYAQVNIVLLIVEFAKTRREAGDDIFEAAIEGARQRFRAVLMTAFSFIFSIIPLVIATGAGAGARRAIGITTLRGMLAATLIGILIIQHLRRPPAPLRMGKRTDGERLPTGA